jgi:hypothetical protein
LALQEPRLKERTLLEKQQLHATLPQIAGSLFRANRGPLSVIIDN